MCGIYGMVSLAGAPLRHPEVMDRMGAALRHRGPDGRGILRTPSAAMGVERLRIVDRHPRADQPFTDPEQQIWVACNGQIYNAPVLRAALSRYPYRSRGDVEPIVPLYLEAGSHGLARLDGMFALSIWDDRRETLTLARDRAGEKPLFYSAIDGEIWYASEVQALLEHPHATRDLDLGAIHDYLTWGYVREPRTMFARIRKVEAGTIVTMGREGRHVVRYFDPVAVAHASIQRSDGRSMRGPVHPPMRRFAEDARSLRFLLENAVIRQTRADVPVGVFASGGLDSSVLSALTARVLGPRRTHTFTLRFADPLYDESRFARQVAESLGTRHREVAADQSTLSGALDTVVRGVAEPLADPAIMPTWLLARAAREDVGVVLSGEGADELFGGYPTYQGHRLAEGFRGLPLPVRRVLERVVFALPVSSRPVAPELLLKRFFAHADAPWLERHLAWFGTGLPETGALRTNWFSSAPSAPSAPPAPPAPVPDPLTSAMLFDYQSYLRDDLLVKMDRATMLAGLEGRAPYLDTTLQEFALALPPDLKLHGLTTKWLLKQAARAWLPHRLVHRRKRGFSVPVAQWLNQGLAAEADRLLDPGRLRRRGWLHPGRVEQLLSEHRGGRANHARPLWAILVLESWLEQWATPEGPA